MIKLVPVYRIPTIAKLSNKKAKKVRVRFRVRFGKLLSEVSALLFFWDKLPLDLLP